MPYSVKEIFYTLQGEGANAGRPAVFCRFAGCNLWSGQEKDRTKALCKFCDTDFLGTNGPGGGVFASTNDLAQAAERLWPLQSCNQRLIVCTGGEPLLQLDETLVAALKERGFQVAVETNGTVVPPPGIDWVCVSPKGHNALAITQGNELKLVFPQDGLDPHCFESLKFDYFFLQPMDGHNKHVNTDLAVKYCLTNPRWRLSIQMHKVIGVP